MDKITLLRSVLCLQYHNSRHILGQKPIIRCSHTLTRTLTSVRKHSLNSVSLTSRRLSIDGLKNVGDCHFHQWLYGHIRSLSITHNDCLSINQSSSIGWVQPSNQFSTSSSHRDTTSGNKDDADDAPSSTEGSRDAVEELAASKERQASVRTLLDDAKSAVKIPDEFDFDGDLETSPGERRQQPSKPRIDPAETSVLLFPGQGSQFVGMGRDLLKYPNVEDMFAVASEILGYEQLHGLLFSYFYFFHCTNQLFSHNDHITFQVLVVYYYIIT